MTFFLLVDWMLVVTSDLMYSFVTSCLNSAGEHTYLGQFNKSCITDSAHQWWTPNFCFDGSGWHPQGTRLKSLTGCGQGFCRPPTSQVSWVRRISMKRVRRIGWQTGHHCQRVPALAWRGLSINLRRVLQMERSSDCWCTTTVYRNYYNGSELRCLGSLATQWVLLLLVVMHMPCV